MLQNLMDSHKNATEWARAALSRLEELRAAAGEMDQGDVARESIEYVIGQVLPEVCNANIALSRMGSDLVTLRETMRTLKELANRN